MLMGLLNLLLLDNDGFLNRKPSTLIAGYHLVGIQSIKCCSGLRFPAFSKRGSKVCSLSHKYNTTKRYVKNQSYKITFSGCKKEFIYVGTDHIRQTSINLCRISVSLISSSLSMDAASSNVC
ncbi:hypothetical protein TNCT_660781 [Trichonephila clavata]|uniref:Uncharacterized protein n=1 Tax=Trichonephila clavata TaxID=2740835 RepID=A0A8X6H3R5_TRICU|nr:hypothetical protein TNCT_660781 [Trichonephila clavata]